MHCGLHAYIQRVGYLSRRSAEVLCEHVLSTWEAKIESVQENDCLRGGRAVGRRGCGNFGQSMEQANPEPGQKDF